MKVVEKKGKTYNKIGALSGILDTIVRRWILDVNRSRYAERI